MRALAATPPKRPRWAAAAMATNAGAANAVGACSLRPITGHRPAAAAPGAAAVRRRQRVPAPLSAFLGVSYNSVAGQQAVPAPEPAQLQAVEIDERRSYVGYQKEPLGCGGPYSGTRTRSSLGCWAGNQHMPSTSTNAPTGACPTAQYCPARPTRAAGPTPIAWRA